MAFCSPMYLGLSSVALALTVHLAIAAPDGRAPLEGVSAVRAANYGAPSKLVQQRDEVAPIMGELSELRKKRWRKGDTKMRCYATVVLLAGNRQVAMFRIRPDQIVERPVEKGESSYSLELAETDLPQLRKLLGEIPKSKMCD
jgi:hypothetical protein